MGEDKKQDSQYNKYEEGKKPSVFQRIFGIKEKGLINKAKSGLAKKRQMEEDTLKQM